MPRRTLLLGHLPRNLARTLAGAAALCTVGCLGDLGDSNEMASDTDSPPCIYQGGCNGVQVFCDNDGSTPNYWWVPWAQCDHLGTITNSGCGMNDEHCCLGGGLEPENCFCKQYGLPAFEGINAEMGMLCVGEGFPAAADPLQDWETGGFPSIDDEIAAWCSAQCVESHDIFGNDPNEPDPNCVNANWTGHRTYPDWNPADGYNCQVPMELNVDDPDGSEIPWELAGGTSDPIPATCDLNGDCIDWFYPSVGAFFHPALGSAGFIEPESRGAHYLAVDTGASQLAINMPGVGAGFDDVDDMYGTAEYTALDCDDDVCPFLLADLTAYNTLGSWAIAVQTAQGAKKKTFSDVHVDLFQSTLGLRNMALDKVAFAPGALRLFVQFHVNGTGFLSGDHGYFVENTDYVFAEYDNGSLSLNLTFPMQTGGVGTLTVEVAPDEHPPVADHDLAVTEWCDGPQGLELAPHLAASDPDNDVNVVIWWIDGEPCSGDCWLPEASHEVVLEVHDARDARVVSDMMVVTVKPDTDCP
jgi:hypothetical protein